MAPPTETPEDGAVRCELDDGSEDWLVREEPLLIAVHGNQLLTMRTPGRDLDLATGFLLSEGVVERADDVRGARTVSGDPSELRADEIHVELRDPGSARVEGRLTRTHEIRASCGICGLTDADQLLEGMRPLLPGVPRLSEADVYRLRARFVADQPLFTRTGACHAAMIFGPDGAIWGHGEDVGRHNALDKAIGQAARDGQQLERAVALLSGRAGFDLVLKCLRVRLPVVLSVSAASALSFELCRSAGATLIGFVREDRMKIYWSGGRING